MDDHLRWSVHYNIVKKLYNVLLAGGLVEILAGYEYCFDI